MVEQTPNAQRMMIDALRELLDTVAAADADEATLLDLGRDLRRWSGRLADRTHDKFDPVLFTPAAQAERARALTPPITGVERDDRSLRARVRFGRHFGEARVHGGAIPLLLLEVCGRLVNSSPRPSSRTAYFRTDYRAGTPTDQDLDVHAWIVSETGRKRILRCELRHGETLCVEGEGLFIAVGPGVSG